MSDTVRKSGKLVPFMFSSDNLTIYEMIQELITAGVNIDESESIEYDSITGSGVVVIHGNVYLVKDVIRTNVNDGYANVTDNGDGTFDFDTVYYNGSSFLEEQLEEAFDESLDESLALIRIVHDKSNVRVWDINLDNKYSIKEYLDRIGYDTVREHFYYDIDNEKDEMCSDCEDICDEDMCHYVHDQQSYRDEIAELKAQTDNSNAQDIVFEYLKLNTQLPIEIIKELGKDEVYRIIKQLDWHI